MSTNTSASPVNNTDEVSAQIPNPSNANPDTTDESRESVIKVLTAQGEVFSQEVRRDFASFELITNTMKSADLQKIVAAAEPISTYEISEMEKQSLSVSLQALEMRQVLETLSELGARLNTSKATNTGIDSNEFGSETPPNDASEVPDTTKTDMPAPSVVANGDTIPTAPSSKEDEELIPWDSISKEEEKILRRRYGIENLKDAYGNGFTKEEFEFLTREQPPFVWKVLSLDKQLEQMQMILPSEGTVCAMLPCGGEVYINLATTECCYEHIPTGIDVILGNYGLAYGKYLPGHSIARAPHKSNLMSLVTWDKMYYMAPNDNYFTPLLLNLSFLGRIARDITTGSSLFFRYVANELVIAYEEGNFEVVYGIAGLDSSEDASVLEEHEENELDVESFVGEGTVEICSVELAGKESQQETLVEPSCQDNDNQVDAATEEPTTNQEGNDTPGDLTANQEGDDTAEDPTATQEGGDTAGDLTANQESDYTVGEPAATQEGDDIAGEPAATQESDDTAEVPRATQEGDDTVGEPAATQEGDDTAGEPAATQESDDTAGEPAATQEGEAVDKPKRHYSMEQDPESMEKRIEAIKKENEILGLDVENVPSPEELKAMDDSISKQKRHDFVDPVTLIKAVKDALTKAIWTTLTHNELFIDPKTKEPSPIGFNPKGCISFEETVRFLMSGLNGGSTQSSIKDFFPDHVNAKTIWNSRRQISEECMKFLFEEFIRNLMASEDLAPVFSEKLFGQYHAFGIDGSCLNLPLNKKDAETYCSPTKANRKGYNQIHGVFFYGLFSGIYHSVILNSKKKTAERATLLDIVKNNEYLRVLEEKGDKYIILADRGFESWEVFAKLSMMGINFIIRIKDSKSGGILKSFGLKAYDQFEVGVNVVFHAKGFKSKASANARYAAFLDEDTAVVELSLRVLQFRLQKGGKLEALITNIPMSDLTALQLEYLYSLRWNQELSFRMLKYKINMRYIHSKETLYIRQELWAKLTMFNFASVILSHIKVPEAKWSKGRKHEYAINKVQGVHLCFKLLAGTMDVQTMARIIVMNLQPIRPGRTFKRKVKPQSNVGFHYRAVG